MQHLGLGSTLGITNTSTSIISIIKVRCPKHPELAVEKDQTLKNI